ncbi:transcription factor GTE8-like [Juglans microcarpa x Juglans regia]|uniref:transcription factor GTE8-like n=1 Tax=Juglans microcarpa x Juglans regia TaxID=2249226 RepID=UPI001B7E1810|nr:transcription factor GTE8-like [Juglans microcarpa x Juglans regia]XP_041007236.1 transcription factor GTE8-like [Juglans microcarpa x Juglans regia]XP_041007237.1 transcription factor GTE8-like [Juglans microcarpa x Juglans regia]
MVGKNDRYPGGYYGNTINTAGESEGSGISGRIDIEITASEDSNVPKRKCISLNSKNCDAFGVPMQVLPLSNMLRSERKELIHRLKLELQEIRVLQTKVELQRTNAVTLSSSSDILSCSNAQTVARVENVRKSSAFTSVPSKKLNNPCHGLGKKLNPTGPKQKGWNRSMSGRFESTPSTANVILMKQCEALLKRLMSHQYAWVFNTPVDVEKLNIPDYHTVIKHPMDLGTIKTKLASGAYSSLWDFHADVKLTFNNAMTYNPPGNNVYLMADTLAKYFDLRWKAIEKKLPKTDAQLLPAKSGPREDVVIAKKVTPPSKKRKITSLPHEVMPKPVKRIMTDEEKHSLGRELESLLGEIPVRIIDFLREHSSNGRKCGEDEIEIDIDDLSDDTLFSLRKLLDDYLQEKQKKHARTEPCEIELFNESGPSNSFMQPCKGNDPGDGDIDFGGNEPPITSYPPVEIEKNAAHRTSKCISSGRSSDLESGSPSESESDGDKASIPADVPKVPEAVNSGAQLDEKTNAVDPLEGNQSVSGLDQVEQTVLQKPSSVDQDCRQDGDSAPTERQVSPEKLYRAALLKNRFADTILKAREKTLTQGEKWDPEKLRREREELELERWKEKARLQREAKAAEEARRRAEAEDAAESRRKRELEREAARQALLQMEKTVEINDNSLFLEDLEMLRSGPAEQLPSSVDETSPDHSQDGLGSFKFGGSNPLEQLGLFMKVDEEEEVEPPSNPVNDVEEGEID